MGAGFLGLSGSADEATGESGAAIAIAPAPRGEVLAGLEGGARVGGLKAVVG